MNGDSEPCLTAREVATLERVSVDMVKRALKSGALRGHKVGGRGDWRIAECDHRAWVAAGAPTQMPKSGTGEAGRG